jgi:hypothetical protein
VEKNIKNIREMEREEGTLENEGNGEWGKGKMEGIMTGEGKGEKKKEKKEERGE